MNPLFDREKLEGYQASLAFVVWLEPLMQKLPKTIAVRDQLDRASTSIVLNLAEGNGKFTLPDRCRLKERLHGIVSMLVGLIKANSGYRLHEGNQD